MAGCDPQLMPGMRYPVAAQAEFWKQMVPDSLANLPTPNPTVPALSELAQKINGTVLMSHSQSGVYPFQAAVLNKKGIAGVVSAPRLKNCRAFVAAANAAGGKAELLVLPEIGIKGNTHMLMQDDNSLEIADILLTWIGKNVRPM